MVDEDTLDDTVLIVREFNAQLVSMNQSIDQQIARSIEEISLLHKLFPESETVNLLTNSGTQQPPDSGLSDNNVIAAGAATSEMSAEEPTGLLHFIHVVHNYFFNIHNLLWLLGFILLISVFLRILNFVLNRIY